MQWDFCVKGDLPLKCDGSVSYGWLHGVRPSSHSIFRTASARREAGKPCRQSRNPCNHDAFDCFAARQRPTQINQRLNCARVAALRASLQSAAGFWSRIFLKACCCLFFFSIISKCSCNVRGKVHKKAASERLLTPHHMSSSLVHSFCAHLVDFTTPSSCGLDVGHPATPEAGT